MYFEAFFFGESMCLFACWKITEQYSILGFLKSSFFPIVGRQIYGSLFGQFWKIYNFKLFPGQTCTHSETYKKTFLFSL